MVSAALSDALFNPSVSLEELYAQYSGDLDTFPAHVTKHFASLFELDDAFLQIPPLSLNHPPEIYQPRSLVRFRGMVQDTPQSEIYSSIIQEEGAPSKLGGWGHADSIEYHGDVREIDYGTLRDRVPYWVVSVPGESEWVDEYLRGGDYPVPSEKVFHQPSAPQRFHNPLLPHVGVNVKVYDTNTSVFKPTDVVTFVGILSFDIAAPDVFEPEASHVKVACLHVLFSRTEPKTVVPFPFPAVSSASVNPSGNTLTGLSREDVLGLRNELIEWIADEALCGDREVAEWVITTSVSRVHSRHTAMLPLSLTITSFPPPASLPPPEKATPLLHSILGIILPLTQAITLPLDLAAPPQSNTPLESQTPTAQSIHFVPYSDGDYLHSGLLQVPPGTVLTILETNVQEGKLPAGAVENLDALQKMVLSQKLHYRYPFGSSFEFPTDIPTIVLCEGGKGNRSVFLPKTGVVVPLRPPRKDNYLDPYRALPEIKLPSAQKLDMFRCLMGGAKSGTAKVGRDVGEYIQSDFVEERKETGGGPDGVTPEDLMLRMNILRHLAASLHEPEVTPEVWRRAKAMDRSRKARLQGKA